MNTDLNRVIRNYRRLVGWAKRSVPTITSTPGMVGTAQVRLCPPYDSLFGLALCAALLASPAAAREKDNALVSARRTASDVAGLNAPAPLVSCRVATSFPVSVSWTRTLPGPEWLPVTTHRPSGLTAANRTSLWGAVSTVWGGLPRWKIRVPRSEVMSG